MESIQDPKILAIMAKLDERSAEREAAKPEETIKTEAPKKVAPSGPPKSFEEFLQAEKMDEWPQRITSENLLDLQEERNLLGTKDEIMMELSKAVPYSMKMLDDLEDSLGSLEDKLNQYANKILTGAKRESRLTDKLFFLPDKAFMTEVAASDAVRAHPSRKGKRNKNFAETVKETQKKSVEHCSFPGFRDGELTELPSQLEAPQILHRVTKAQDFNPGFKKFWKKIWLSEASVALMQDTFWWIFVSCFEMDRTEEQDKLFDRIADSFVALFTSINPEVKDKFFMVYCDCLSQAVFAAFNEAFPESARHFQGEFKQFILNTTSEWITGLKQPPGGYNRWDVQRLEPKAVKDAESSQTQTVRNIMSAAVLNQEMTASLDMEDFHRTMQRLGGQPISLVTDSLQKERPQVTANNTGATGGVQQLPALSTSRQALCGTPRRRPQESHQVGPSHDMERVMFNIKGQSPLVAHYLTMRKLREAPPLGPQVRRTEVSKLQPEGPTYQQIINETRTTSKLLSSEYQKICDMTNQEIQRLERQKRMMNQQMEKLKKDLMFSKNSTEIRILSQRILENREKEPSSLSGRGSTDEEDEYDDDSDEQDEG